LTANDSAEFGRGTEGGDDSVDVASLDTVDDVVTAAGYKMTVLEYCYIRLLRAQPVFYLRMLCT